jgi:branched-chain amino acid transport system permease protein
LHAVRIRPAWVGVVFLVGVTLVFTTALSTYSVYVLDTVLLACMGAVALQVLQGTAGLASVGTAGFLLIGAFGSVFFNRSGFAFPFDVIGGTVFAGAAGLITGLSALRLRALFLALATLAAYFIALFLGTLYQGSVPAAQFSGFQLPTLFSSGGLKGKQDAWAWIFVGVLSLVILGASRIVRERSGRALRMMREHENIAPVMGIPVARYKLITFVLSSMVIGCEGGLLAHFSGSVSTDNFTLLLSFQYVVMIVIGGLDSIAGAVIGATIVVGLPIVVPNIVSALFGSSLGSTNGSNISLIVYGLLVCIFVASWHDGIVGLFRSVRSSLASLWTQHVPRADKRSGHPRPAR